MTTALAYPAFEALPQFKSGTKIEGYLDAFFRAHGYQIERTSEWQERVAHLGDRVFERDGERQYVEYKSGIQTHYTGNVFLETVSVDIPEHFKAGWVYTCRADLIVYATILDGVLLVFWPDNLRRRMKELKERFPEVATSHQQNNGYNSRGVVVPFEWAKKLLAYQVIQL